MDNKIEIKATNKELAIKRAIKILEITADQIVQIIEIEKPKSFFGFFEKEGLYKIEFNRKLNSEINKTTTKKEEIINIIKKDKKIIKETEILNLAKNLLSKMGLNLEVEILNFNEKYCNINLSGEDIGIIIGKKGKTLNSYEYLLNSFVKEVKIDIDAEGFKEKRNETLRELGRKMAEKVIKTSKIIRLNPMPPRERKIIHEVLNTYSELETYSEGKDPKRYIIIKKIK